MSFVCNDDNIKSRIIDYTTGNLSNYPSIGLWDVSNVTNMDSLFANISSFNENINDWNVSNVTNMDSMFLYASNFNQPLDKWNVSNVLNMENMFSYAINFNQPLNSWDVSKVENMARMFACTNEFNQPLNDWNVSNVHDTTRMFYGAKSFDQNISSWNLDNIDAEDLKQMYNKCPIKQEYKAYIQYDTCIICLDPLDNYSGPDPNEKCINNCSDVITVCKRGHMVHRGCALNACLAEPVDIASQMGMSQYSALRPQARANKCPVCFSEPLNPSCDKLDKVNAVENKYLPRIRHGGSSLVMRKAWKKRKSHKTKSHTKKSHKKNIKTKKK